MRCRECNADLPAEARFCLSCGAASKWPPRRRPRIRCSKRSTTRSDFESRIERLLGRGGMGAVYLAHELALDRDVAIKVLPPEHASTPQLRERFKREARTAARLSHPNIVPLHTFGEVSGLVYFVWATSPASRSPHGFDVRGRSIRKRLERSSPRCAMRSTRRTGRASSTATSSPTMSIEAYSGAPLLTDFGIAKATLTDAQLTTAGQLIGTPHYMSPEQAMGKADVGPRSESIVGIVAFEMLSGQRPFEAETPLDALTQRLTHDPRPLGSIAPHVPEDLVQAINRCLQKDPATRWSDAKSLREALVPSDEESEDTFLERILEKYGGDFALLARPRLFSGLPRPQPRCYIQRCARGHSPGHSRADGARGVLGDSAAHAGNRRSKHCQEGPPTAPLVAIWYPRSLRRRGDMWDRLPRELRRFRAWRGLVLMYGGLFSSRCRSCRPPGTTCRPCGARSIWSRSGRR